MTEFKHAAKLRDLIVKIADTRIRDLSPQPRLGMVQHIDRANNRIQVKFAGDSTLLTVAMTPGNQPQHAADDPSSPDVDMVRVGGRNGNFYLMDVITSGALNLHYDEQIQQVQDQVDPLLSDGVGPASSPKPVISPLGYGGVAIRWGAIPNPDPVRYKIYFDSVNPPVQFLTDTTGLVTAASTLPDGTPLDPHALYYAQVECYDADDTAGKGAVSDAGGPVVVPANAVSEDILVANSLFSRNGYFGDIEASQITAGIVNVLLTLAIGGGIDVGDAISINTQDGIVIRLPDGNVIQFPASGLDPAVISGALRTNSLIVDSGLKVTGRTGNIIEGEVVAAAAISPPVADPVLTTTWTPDLYITAAGVMTNRKALFYYAPDDRYYIVRADSASPGWQEHSQVDGSLAADHTIGTYARLPQSIIRRTINGHDRTLIMGVESRYWYISWYDAPGPGALYFEGDIWSTTQYPASRVPMLGTDGSADFVAWVDGNGALRIKRFIDLTSDSISESGSDSSGGTTSIAGLNGVFPANATLTGFCVTPGVMSSAKYFIMSTASHVYVYDGTGLRRPELEWDAPNGDSIVGVDYVPSHTSMPGDSGYVVRGASGKIYRMATTVINGVRSVKYTWYNAANDIESTPSPIKSYTVPNRNWLRVTTEGLPSDGSPTAPDRVRIYFENNLQPDPGVGVISFAYGTKVTGLKAPDGTPTEDGFANVGTPGLLRALASEWEWHGDGAAKAFDFEMDSSGRRIDPLLATTQTVLTANAAPTSTANVAMPSLDQTITSPGVYAQFAVEMDADVTITNADSVNLIELLVDGVAQPTQLLSSGAGAGTRISGHKKWVLTGLAQGDHALTFRTRNTTASSGARVNSSHTVVSVSRER